LQTFVVYQLRKLILGMAGVCSPKVSVVYGLWIYLLLNQNQKCFWNCAWSFQL